MFTTSVIGSYPKPKWLLRTLSNRKASEEEKRSALDDAVRLVLKEQELAGVDIPSDGEMRRTEMTEYFTSRIGGFVFKGPVRVWGNNYFNKAAVVDRVTYLGPMLVDEFRFARASTEKRLKVPITGPYTIADWSFNEYYRDKLELADDLAGIINMEMRELAAAGADFLQVDEPAMSTHPEEVSWAVDVLNKAVAGVPAKLAVHICYGDYRSLFPRVLDAKVDQFALEFTNRRFRDLDLLKEYGYQKELGLGVIDVHNPRVETVEEVKQGIRKALEVLPPEKIYVNPDCGLKLLSKETALEKLKVMVRGAREMERELETGSRTRRFSSGIP
ncbi:MAG: methionine synthase [TACK group archaeon]|nr:methionine synthase [TACK group archaeon]